MKRLCLFGIAVIISLGWAQTVQSLSTPPDTLPETFHGGWRMLTAEESAAPEMKAHDMSGKLPKLKTPPPSDWDWRNKDGHDWMTSVKNQHSPQHCGACWAFAAVSMIEARYKIANNLPDSESNPDFSEQFVVSCCTDNSGCGGGAIEISMKFLAETGVPDEDCFPYQASNLPCSLRCSDWESKVVKGVVDWGYSKYEVSDYKTRIMEGPVSAGVASLQHAMCLCGWNSSGQWLYKNSWGSNQSYMWLSEAPFVIGWTTMEATEWINLDKYEINEPNDGIWNPGELVDIIITLKSKGKEFTNVTGQLSISNSDVAIFNDTYNFGTIPDGQTADNSTNPFKATATVSATEHDVEFKLHITADGDYSKDISFKIPIGVARFDYMDVLASDATLTVTDVASIGSDNPDGNGSGFVYPADGKNTLFYASMAFGNSSSYLVDNWYISAGSDNDWKPTTSPNGRLRWVSPPTRGDTMTTGYYDDSGISSAKNVTCRQDAWAFKDPNYDDFVILSFWYINNGSSTLTNLYSAIFADFDIIGGIGRNKANINESKSLAWVSGEGIYAGITLLDPVDKLANASTINNVTYIYPDDGMTDANQYKFMNKTFHFGSQSSNGDYGVVISAGPFDLAPGGSQIVAFAIVGGETKSEIETHADSVRSVYRQIGVEEKDAKDIKIGDVTFNVTPNLMLNTGTITFSLPKASKVTIDVYDITGRLCKNLIGTRHSASLFKAGTHTLKWNMKDKLQAGVFFVKLQTGNTALVKKVLVF